MEAVQFIYNDQPVDFEPTGKDNVMVNATQMAKIFGKKVENFTRIESTQNFIKECLNNADRRYLNIEKEEDLIISTPKAGTWMHRVFALKFAAWLDPAFELWVYVTIDRVINHYFRQQRDAMIDKINYKTQMEAEKNRLLLKHPEIVFNYFDLEKKYNEANSKSMNASKAQFQQLKMELLPKETPDKETVDSTDSE